jgi:hypothetical protein
VKRIGLVATFAAQFLFLIIAAAGCTSSSLPPNPDGSDGRQDAADSQDGTDRGQAPDGQDGQGGDLAGDEDQDGGVLPCATHADCPCAGGVCLSTGACWCPPCQSDADCPAGLVCRSGSCQTWPAQCEGPLRFSPDHGPSTGGTLLLVTGDEFYIGALEWLARIGDGPWLMPVYGAGLTAEFPCTLAFLTPPMPPGTYPVWVLYGWPGDNPGVPEIDPLAQSFTYEASTEAVGHGFCRSAAQCSEPLETCDLGTGRCVPDLCRSLYCDGGPAACDFIGGCTTAVGPCSAATDCKLLRSSCGCHAVLTSDPRTTLDSCALGGCLSCTENYCDREHIEAACLGGGCTEVRGDPQGPSCASLQPVPLQGRVAATGRIRTPRAARQGDSTGVIWMQPEGSEWYRYGTIQFGVVDESGTPQGAPIRLGAPYQQESHPALASDGEGFGATWVSEWAPPRLVFQRLDPNGAPQGEVALISEPMDITVAPVLLGRPGGFQAIWTPNSDLYSLEGIRFVALDPTGAPAAPIESVPWIRPHNDNFAAVRLDEQVVVAWPSDVGGFAGLFWTHLPPGSEPVWQLSEAGYEADMVSTGLGFAAAWRESTNYGEKPISILRFQAFDQDGRALCDALEIQRHSPLILSPHLASLGGVLLLTWFELDSYEEGEPYRLMAAQLRESGLVLARPAEVLSAPTTVPGLFHIRLDDAVLSGLVVDDGPGDALTFLRWECGG